MDVVGDASEHSTDSVSDSHIEDPCFAISCKDSCFDAGAEHHVNEEVKVEDAQPLAYAQVPQLEATLATSDVDQFGEWTILMASSATKDLFQLRRRDAKIAECVLKKIRQVSLRSQEETMSQLCTCRQLSRGEFSGNNYKALHGPFHGIPIYQAEILSNLRLVYQIDCTLDDDGQTERQVVKVYGIYSHKQLDHIWPWLSKLLSGRGKVYRQRCILRERAEPGNGVYRPAIFPPGVEEFTIEQSATFVHHDGTNEDLSWLISNKYVKLSKAYLNGLIAEQDVQLPFQLTTKEWQIVQCLTSCYVIGRSGTGKTTAMAFKMLGIQRAWEQLPGVRKPRQLFVTRFPVLAAKVQEFFTSLVDSLALAGRTEDELRTLRSLIRSAEQEQPPMIDPLNAQNCCLGIPQKYSELSDKHFPLFLSRMIAADIQLDDSKKHSCHIDPKEYDRLKFILDKAINDESLYVTYEVFSTQYWPQLCDTYRSPLAQSFGPWLVFSEFMGVIKGSETAFNSPNGILDRQTYMNLSTRAYPVFAEDRNSLYSTFELYSKLKRERYGYDMADRTYAILKALSPNTLKDHVVDYLYVDEVQDNLIIDAMLLRILCGNADGLFWAGDTAQTISAGSSFRFADLKAFIHRTEAERYMGIEKSSAKPEVFELAVNYRSHGGIVNCAQLVVKLITDFWPESIDTLQPERAMLGGPKPVFLMRQGDEIFPYESFFTGLWGNRELGAEQCIIVRNSVVRDHIREQFGDIAVILTLQESKGLEFNEVFLYNFFEDSAATLAQWCHVSMTYNNQATTSPCDVRRSPPSVLCTELKNLYVGVTRARKKLYLLDCSPKIEPMKELWSKGGLIDVALLGTNVLEYAEESTQEQWAASAYKLFNAGQFQEAVRCFERANLPIQLHIAQAYRLRQVAMMTVRTSIRHKAFLAAAEAFVQCADEACGTQKTSFYSDAAKCYASADRLLEAAKLYIEADDLTAAAGQYRKAGRFDKIAQILNRHRDKITESYDELLFDCVMHYFHNHLRPHVPLFSSTEEELKYLEGKGLHTACIDLLASLGRFLEAAEVQLSSLKQPRDAIRILLDHQDNQPGAMQRVVDIALDTLWQECSFDKPVQDILRNKRSNAHKVLDCIKNIPLVRLQISDSEQIRFFRAVQIYPFSEEVYRLGEEFSDRGEEAMALMAFNVFCSQLPALHSASASEFDNFLKRFERYVRLLASVASGKIPFLATDPQVRKVFGIAPSSNQCYSITEGTFLYRKFAQNQQLSARDIKFLLKTHLKRFLREKVTEENNMSITSQAFATQCPYSVLHDRSHCRVARCHQQHERRMALNAVSYNNKVNLHLQQIRILDLLFSAMEDYRVWRASMTAALHRLYAVLYRPIYLEGSIADLDWNSVRDAAGRTSVTRKWIQMAIEYLEPGDQTNYIDYLMNVIRVTFLHTALGGECLMQEYVSRESCRISYGEQVLTESGNDNVSADIVAFFTQMDSTRGVQAFRFLLQLGVGMDLSVVCNFAEEICSTFISSLHPSGDPSPLHDLVIPRRWIMNPNKPIVPRSIIRRFLYCARYLMNLLRSGKAHMKFDLPANEESFVDIMLARMRRVLCILGYNVCDVGLSKTIAEILLLPPLEVNDTACDSSLQILRQLADLRVEYLKEIQALHHGSVFKDLIHLVYKDSRHPTPSISPRIPQLVFGKVTDISHQMNRAPAF
ncbi:hypothetical protein BKA82DRAFT_4448336 [Pisolithus tinctorius]|nr:hypothetical protein BKA82DRAFT_4448336 [Pisolithus tinctorius]